MDEPPRCAMSETSAESFPGDAGAVPPRSRFDFVHAKAGPLCRLMWNAWWITTLAVALTLSAWLIGRDLIGRDVAAVDDRLYVLYVAGTSLYYGALVGLLAAGFAGVWHVCGAWMLMPVFGAIAGAVGAVVLAAMTASYFRLGEQLGGGLHGGGEFVAILLLGALAVIAALGAAFGAVSGVIVALILAKMRHR